MNLIEELVKNKIINKKQQQGLLEEVKKSSKSLEELVLEKKIVPEAEFFKLKSRVLKIPLKETLPLEIPLDVLSIIPKEAVDFYKMVPLSLDRKSGVLEVGMVRPDNPQAKQALKFLVRQQKLTPKISLISPTSFQELLSKYHTPEREVKHALEALEKEISVKAGEAGAVEKQEFEKLVEEAPVIKMVSVMIRQAVEGGSSDIHIEPTTGVSRVRYRLDGILYSSLTLPAKIHPAIVARIKILSDLKIDETRVPQDGRFSTMVGDKKIDFRVSTFPTTLGEKVVIRILKPQAGLETLVDLGFEGRNLKMVEAATKKLYGMILVTGPTGSGKSTTLYTVLKTLNKEGVNIVTLEDPVEYFMEGVNQSQVKPEIEYTFAKGLRQILRQDPDIIMVGEIRDEETAKLAIHAALTGHLVLSTLHTNNAPGVVPRLTDMGIKSFLISPSLNLVISQRLVRTLCPHCKQKTTPKGETKRYLLARIKSLPANLRKMIKSKGSILVFKPKGCKKCNNKGYTGRMGLFEVLSMTDKLAEVINRNPTEQEIVKVAKEQGMITMEQDGILKVLKGLTSLEEVMKLSEEA